MLKEKNGIFEFKDSNIKLHFTTRRYPILKSNNYYSVIINKIVPGNRGIYVTKQIHSSSVTPTREEGFYIGDGLITDNPGIVLSLFTADCYPVLIYSISPPVIALVHAGWRGIYKNIIENSVKLLKSDYPVNELKAFIGPGICGKCYVVGKEMKKYFPEKHFTSSEKSLRIDLKSVIYDKLRNTHIKSITDSGFCTMCDNDRFFSYRANNKTKYRILTFAYINKMVQE